MTYFRLYFDAHRADKLVWEVGHAKNGQSYKISHYKEVSIAVPVKTIYYGKNAKQPKAVVLGKCKNMMVGGNKLYIT